MTIYISESFINKVVSRVDIVDIISEYISLRKSGDNYTAKCPFHNEKTPSFSINKSKQFYHCFGCGSSGDVIQFLKKYKNINFIEALKILSFNIVTILASKFQIR